MNKLNNKINKLGPDSVPYSLKVDNKTIDLILWDTAGQEKYRAISE